MPRRPKQPAEVAPETPSPTGNPPPDDPRDLPAWWEAELARAAAALRDATDPDQARTLGAKLRGMATAASSGARYHDTANMRRELAEVQQGLEAMRAARRRNSGGG